ncbi:hypothetical protein HAX54_038828 [Datura stramonium]|uniref:Fatty acid hydroxylase domain-containing protein n=1 Tax=Datura stramonium TaxID=4076 RepID=A0ABS8SIR0_DATST|nr:hypothetical protein [Datura stramonium]
MASNPGILVEYPWARLGNFKYMVLAPIVVHNIHSLLRSKEENWWDSGYLLLWPLMLLRLLHGQIWISLNRYRTAKGENRILDITTEFDQPDKERNWDDPIIFTALIFYCGYLMLEQTHNLPIWRIDGIILTALVHIGPVEFLYYWLHRSLHRRYLYSRYHSHHHSSIVTEPTACKSSSISTISSI